MSPATAAADLVMLGVSTFTLQDNIHFLTGALMALMLRQQPLPAASQLHDETPSRPNLSWQPTTSDLALWIRLSVLETQFADDVR